MDRHLGFPGMRTAFDAFEEQLNRPKLTTGHGDLDSLIGGISPGTFTMLYGEQEILSLLVHKLLANCALPEGAGGFDGEAIYFNHTNYYAAKTILDPSLLGQVAKHVGIDPLIVFKRVSVAAAYNEERQKIASKKVAAMIETNKNVRLVVVHNITRFIIESKKPLAAREALKDVIGEVWRASSKNQVALVVTADAGNASRGFIPKPEGGTYLRQVASVIVHFKKYKDGGVRSYKATLTKHPERKTPESIIIYASQHGFPDIATGKSVQSFRQLYEAKLNQLRSFQTSFRDLGHRFAMDGIVKTAWESEQQAISNLRGFELLDGLNVAATVNTRADIESLCLRLKQMDESIKRATSEMEELRQHQGS